MLTKYTITDPEKAAQDHKCIGGDTKFITEDVLTDREAEILHNQGYPYIKPIEPKAVSAAKGKQDQQ